MARPFPPRSLLLALPVLAGGCAGPAEAPPPAAPPPPPAVTLALPAGHMDNAEAARLLAGDPLALRFVALRALDEAGLVRPEEANPRILNNKGALLPLTWPQPPSIGLDRPIPPLDKILARFRALESGTASGSPASRATERAFLLDSLLPARPAVRQALTPPDLVGARRLLVRLDRLTDAGLITGTEKAAESQAVLQLMASGRLPETVTPPAPPPPPPPPKPKHRGHHHPYHGYLAEVLPDPPGADPTPLRKDARGPAGVALLSMAAASYGNMAWAALSKEYSELAPLSYKVVKVDLGQMGVTWRLIAGPLDPPAAEKLCATLKAKGQECVPTPFPH